ncbi:MAG: hypothetical protein HUJ71_09910 [Pseudobutyrivibrio sp.]|nr:hypothetical protein [Pseudobutyrivibrio sp.]
MIDINDDIIVYAIYNDNAYWYVSYKELWYLDYNKRIYEFQEKGYTVDINSIEVIRRDLLEMNDIQIPVFWDRIKNDIWSYNELAEEFKKNLEEDYYPSLYVNFDSKHLISMYREDASYEDYIPDGWVSEYEDFLSLIPIRDRYWE